MSNSKNTKNMLDDLNNDLDEKANLNKNKSSIERSEQEKQNPILYSTPKKNEDTKVLTIRFRTKTLDAFEKSLERSGIYNKSEVVRKILLKSFLEEGYITRDDL